MTPGFDDGVTKGDNSMESDEKSWDKCQGWVRKSREWREIAGNGEKKQGMVGKGTEWCCPPHSQLRGMNKFGISPHSCGKAPSVLEGCHNSWGGKWEWDHQTLPGMMGHTWSVIFGSPAGFFGNKLPWKCPRLDWTGLGAAGDGGKRPCPRQGWSWMGFEVRPNLNFLEFSFRMLDTWWGRCGIGLILAG